MLVGEVFARMGLDSKQYEKDLGRLEGVTQKQATTLGGIFKKAFSVALGIGVFEAVKRGFQTIASTAIGFNAQMEQAQIGFATMLGSAERAEAFLSDMADFAARTPFEFPELLDASKRMLAYGFAAEDVLPTMEAVGNATAALGLGAQGIDRIILALGQMRAKGKLSGEEMRQLTEAGIPAWEMLAEAMGKTTAEIMDMQSKGLIPADRAIKMLVEGMNKRFPNMMKNMENTWEGVTSTIKDVWRMTIGAVTQNLFQGVVSWLQKVRDFAVGFYDTFQKYGLQRAIHESFGPEVAALVSVLGAVLRGLASVVKAVTGFFMQYGKQIKFVAIVMGTYLALTKAVTLAKQLMITVTAIERGQLLAKIPVLNVVSTAMGIYKVQMALAAKQGIVLTGVLAKLRVALYALWSALGPVGWIMLGISVAVGVGTHLWGKYTQSVYSAAKTHDELATSAGQVEESASDAVAAIEDEADALKKAGKAAGKNIQSFDEVHQLQEDMAGSAEGLAESMGLNDTGLGVPEVGDFEIPDIGAQLEEMKPTLAGFWEWIKQEVSNTWNWIKSLGIWDWLGQKWNSLKNIANTAWHGILNIITSVLMGIVNVIQTAWQETWNLLQTYWNNAVKLATDVFGAIWNFIKGTWDNIKTTTFDIWGAIWEFLKSQWETIKTFGGNIFGILGDLITGKIDLRTAVRLIWDEIKNFLSDTWGNIKTLGENIWAAIRNFFETQWELIKTSASDIWTAIKDFFIDNWEATKEAVNNVWTAIKNFFSETWESIKTSAIEYWNAILEFFGTNWEETKQKASEIWQAIKDFFSETWENIKTTAKEIWDAILEFLRLNWESVKQKASEVWAGIKDTITDLTMGVRDKIVEIWSRTKDTLVDLWDNIKRSAQEKWDGVQTVIKGAVNGIIGFINKFIKGWNKIELKVPSIDIPLVGEVGGWSVRLPRIPEIPALATGTNYVPHDMLAYLHKGEAVVPKAYNPAASGMSAEQIEQAMYRAFINAIRVVQASSQQSDEKELVLKIDNTVLARMQLPALTREAQRQGFDLIIRPQGV